MNDKPPAKRPQRADDPDIDGYLLTLGERVRAARARRGMTRKMLSRDSGVSERYLAQLETGVGNVSIARLRRVAHAMNTPLADLVREGPEPPVELTLILEQLNRVPVEQLADIRRDLQRRGGGIAKRPGRIALIGLRGAGKSTLGARLASLRKVPFIQLSREVEQDAGMSLDEIHDLMGQAAYIRLERRCLDRVIERHDAAVIEAGGGLVAEPGTFERLLGACFTVWLRASPEEHMARVMAQGDHRPMAGNREAMADLRRILDGRDQLYRRADAVLDTSGQDIDASLIDLARLCEAAPA